MNKILYFKVKRDLKNINEQQIKEIVEQLQEHFKIENNSNVFEIENKITDEEYSKYIKKYRKSKKTSNL